MNSVTYITLDLQAPNLAVVVSAKQNDTLGRQIAATLRDGSASFDATGLLCEIRYAKPDGTVGFYDTLEDNTTPAYTIDGNVVTFTLAEQMLTVAGAVHVDLNFYAATGEKLTAFAFCLQVEASVLFDGTIVSSDYYNVLTATLAEAAEIAANLPQPSSNTPVADSASGSAGTGNGFARGNHSHPINVPTSGTPANLGTASNGSASTYARSDHVHAMPSASDVGALPNTTTAADLDVKYKLFNSVVALGLTGGSATIAGAWDALGASQGLVCPATEFVTGSTGVPVSADGLVAMVKGTDPADGFIHLHYSAAANGDYKMGLSAGVPTGKWLGNCDLLWTNPDPTTAFDPQTVAVDLNGYTAIMVMIYQQTTALAITSTTTVPNVVGVLGRCFSMANYRQYRMFNIVNNGVDFADGYSGAPAANATVDNASAIPAYIYGLTK